MIVMITDINDRTWREEEVRMCSLCVSIITIVMITNINDRAWRGLTRSGRRTRANITNILTQVLMLIFVENTLIRGGVANISNILAQVLILVLML